MKSRDDIFMLVNNVWKDVLTVDAISADADYFHLGGNSIYAYMIITAINDSLIVDLSISDIFDHPTVNNLVDHITKKYAYV